MEPIKATSVTFSGSPTNTDNTTWNLSWDMSEMRFEPKKTNNPHIPADMYVNEEERYVTFIYSDGTEIKLVCDSEDNFSPVGALAYATMYRVLGGSKTQFKKKWWNIIARRITWLGNTTRAEDAELGRVEKLKQEKKEKDNKKAKLLLESRKKELETLIGEPSVSEKKKVK